MHRHFAFRSIFASLVCAVAGTTFAQSSTFGGIYATQQAAAGATLYTGSCIECHGATLRGGEGGPALVGAAFWNKWAGQPLAALFQIAASTMPVNNRNGFSPA